MWRQYHAHSRTVAAMTLNPSAGPYGGHMSGSKTTLSDDKVVFMALGTFFGLIFLLLGIQIYVRCVWRRIQTSVVELDDESEEVATRADIYIREIGRRRNWRRRLHHYFDERSESSSPTQHIPVGLDKSVLETLPTFVFDTDATFKDEMVCAVCLEDFVDGERGRLLPKCSHCFHVQCIDMWFLSHSSCPLCRCEVSAPFPETMSDPLLQNSRSCPDFSQISLDRSEHQQEQEPWPGPSAPIVTGFRDPSSPEECPAASSSPEGATVSHANTSANMIPANASIVGAHDSNDALYLERGSSLSRRAAATALEIYDANIRVTEEDQHMSSSQQKQAEVEVVIERASSLDIPSPGSPLRNSLGSNPFLEYQPELHPSTSIPRLTEMEMTTPAFYTSNGSPHHARSRSFLAVEIIGEYGLDASYAASQVDLSTIRDVRLQPT